MSAYTSAPQAPDAAQSNYDLSQRFSAVRATSLALCQDLTPEDTVVQSMPDVSPTKWHLAHVTWFFERFVLAEFDSKHRLYDKRYHFLFNSYYHTVGDMHSRPQRGLLSRPTYEEVLAYRNYVDECMLELLSKRGDEQAIVERVEIGLHHENQHQELLLADIKHVFWFNPLAPAVKPDLALAPSSNSDAYLFLDGAQGLHQIGAHAQGFCFDNETPRHTVLLSPHGIGSRLVTNAEYRDFIEDNGYGDVRLWLSDGWTVINQRDWKRPLYWNEHCDAEFTLGGLREIDPHAPVSHISFYEADAFARWANARLPTEQEWEVAASATPVAGNLLEADYWHPIAADTGDDACARPRQLFGDVWEWTSSAYLGYPGFKPLRGALGEYNGKFMSSQMTVRGGSCISAAAHIRASYRSFFYPDARWQFLGLRLARDITHS